MSWQRHTEDWICLKKRFNPACASHAGGLLSYRNLEKPKLLQLCLQSLNRFRLVNQQRNLRKLLALDQALDHCLEPIKFNWLLNMSTTACSSCQTSVCAWIV